MQMGGSGKWMKSLMGHKNSERDHNHQENQMVSNKGKKWKLWRNSSGSRNAQSEVASETSSVAATGDPLTATLAALARAPPKDFLTIRQEWAAVRIQTAFRSFLARRALKALKGIVKIQALVRGRKERKKVADTYKSMQAIFRVQEKVRAQRLEASSELSPLEGITTSYNPVKLADEDGWCVKQGSVDEIRAKMQMRQEAAIKRERALSYANSSQQQWKAATPTRKSSCLKSQETNFSNPDSVQIKRNNISTRVGLKPVLPTQSGLFSDFDSSSLSSSSPIKLSYMGLTESTKAKMTQRKALTNVSNLENDKKLDGFRVRKCVENKENCRLEGRITRFA